MLIITAVLLDAIFGDPKNAPHPVALIGGFINFLERKLPAYDSREKRARGVELVVIVTFTVVLAVLLLIALTYLIHPLLAGLLELYLLYAAMAQRSLKDETLPVEAALAEGDLYGARLALSKVVGRDTENLDEVAIVRATVETTAESYIDGVFSALFYMVLGGLLFGASGSAVFVWLFKSVSTMDSMIGYDDERYKDFGRAAAKLDDVLNFIPARLGALVAILAGAVLGMDCVRAFKVFLRDRKKHKSPNSAHGESVFAGLLGISLGGGSFYGGVFEPRPWIGDYVREPRISDILSAHKILDVSTALCMLALIAWLVFGGAGI
jgi:adenosylcobinamide-phosphate synthase